MRSGGSQPADVGRIGDLASLSDRGHRPAGPGGGIVIVGLERHDRTADRGGQLAAGSGADHDVAGVHGEVH